MQQNKIEELKQYGFVFNGYQGFIDKANLAQMAMDASLLTPPNSGIPVEYTAFLDPAIIRILNAPRRARKLSASAKSATGQRRMSALRRLNRPVLFSLMTTMRTTANRTLTRLFRLAKTMYSKRRLNTATVRLILLLVPSLTLFPRSRCRRLQRLIWQ